MGLGLGLRIACLDSGCPSNGLPRADLVPTNLTPTHSPRPEQPAGQRSTGLPMHSPSSAVELVHAGRTHAHVSESFRKQRLRLGVCRCTRSSHLYRRVTVLALRKRHAAAALRCELRVVT